MSNDNDLCQLGSHIEDAREHLNRAVNFAYCLIDAGPEQDDPGWPAMGTLIDRLDAIKVLLADLPGPEIREAIATAEAYMDEMSDRADGASY